MYVVRILVLCKECNSKDCQALGKVFIVTFGTLNLSKKFYLIYIKHLKNKLVSSMNLMKIFPIFFSACMKYYGVQYVLLRHKDK